MCLCVSVLFCGVTLQVYSPMCLFVILAGNWVLLICVWGCRFCSNIAHMHTKRLYELNTCLQRRSSSSSLACCLPKINKKYLTASITEMVIQPVPSPHLVSLLPVGLSSDLVTDGADKNVFVCLPGSLKPPGGNMLMRLFQISHTSTTVISQMWPFISLFLPWCFISCDFFFSSRHLIDCICPYSHLHLFFNNRVLCSFIPW